jgi:hypothetical protein
MTNRYLAHRETDVVLRDGGTMHIRPARPDDRAAVEDYFLRLSPESRRLRFWSATLDVGEAARSAVDIDHVDHETLLAVWLASWTGRGRCAIHLGAGNGRSRGRCECH